MGPCLRISFYNQTERPPTNPIYNVITFILALTTTSTAHIFRYLSLKRLAIFCLSLIALVFYECIVRIGEEKKEEKEDELHAYFPCKRNLVFRITVMSSS